MPPKLNLIGQKFGRLTVIKEANPKYTSGGNKKICWYCNCDCGKVDVIASTQDLKAGHSKSCGCLNLEQIHASHNHKTNQYDLSGAYGIGYTSSGEEFWFDLEDYDLIKDYCWHKHRNYIEAKIRETGKHIGLHKLVMHDEDNLYDIDHINTDNHNDNRKCNLRITTRQQNNMNRTLGKNNKSGVTGVYWSNYHHAWRANIRVNYKNITLGQFQNKEDAIRCRKQAEEKYFGEFSYDNSQKIANDYKEKK